MSGKPGQQYWRSLDELADTDEFREFLYREFPAGATEMLDSSERRQFLRIMGASFALAGMGLAGCRRWPKETIAPYAHRPEGRAPGLPTHYATSMELNGIASGLLVTSFDGRPTKIEGNPEHPINRGATDAWAQASVLELYDPDRSRHIMHREGGERKRATDGEFRSWVRTHFDGLADGGGLAILSEASDSPSMLDMRTRLLKRFPGTRWFEYEPLNRDNAVAGTKAAFGGAWRPQYRFDRAKVIVSLDADFLSTDPPMVRNTRQFAESRRMDGPGGSISRLYALESVFTITGANADTRVAVRSADIAPVAALLAARLVPDAAPAAGTRTATSSTLGVDEAVLDAIVHDLETHKGEGLVLAGPRQPAEVHVLAHLLNDRLGNVGTTVSYTALPDARSSGDSIAALHRELTAGTVTTLVILGGDPVYNAPADLDFRPLLDGSATTIHLSLYDNETSRHCTWHVPRAQYLESWGDARAWDGTWSVVQPLIEPLLGGRSTLELLALLTGDQVTKGYDIVRRTMSESARRTDFESLWRRTLHDGFLAGSAATLQTQKVRRGAGAAAVETIWEDWTPAGEGTFELVFVPDMKVFDGRYANSGWLQELPDPLTKLTWDNAILMGVDAAERLRLETGDLARIVHGGRELTAAVLVMPGQHPGSVTLPLGYGQALGVISDGAGFNFYTLRTSSGMGFASGASIDPAGGSYTLATTQHHHAIDSVGGRGKQNRLPSLFREATVSEYRDNPGFANDHHHTGAHVAHRLSLWEEDNLKSAEYAWAMSIDLNTCTGCNACVIACQAENNIAIVGKDQVKRGREMHWLRVDRYFKGRNAGTPDAAVMQPVPCMMCENAPCEQVCPVAATTHDKDGLNVMIYNRCVGTRYCSNNCPYKVRRFNYYDYAKRRPVREGGLLHVQPDYYTRPQSDTDPLRKLQYNPEVTVRTRGVMEKCTYCVQRIAAAKIAAKNAWVKQTPAEKARDPRVTVPDGSFTTACAQACPARAIVFGDKNDPDSRVAAEFKSERTYEMLEELNTKPRTRYQAKLRNPAATLASADTSHGEAAH